MRKYAAFVMIQGFGGRAGPFDPLTAHPGRPYTAASAIAVMFAAPFMRLPLILFLLCQALVTIAEKVDAPLLYRACGLEGSLDPQVFAAAIARAERTGKLPKVIAIADMTQPSTARRLYVVDLENRKLLLRTWVAHGKGSGEERCERTSNKNGSLCTCSGLMRVGQRITSPKHGDALLLHGLEKGVNDHAQEREIIIHGADYVGAEHIREHGRLGRSWGCPAVAPDVMQRLLGLLPEGSLLYVYAN